MAARGLLLIVAGLALLPGCRQAAVEPSQPKVETRVSAGEPAYLVRGPATAKEVWHREFQVVLDAKPASEDEGNKLASAQKSEIEKSVATLLEEIRAAVEARRKPSDKWSLLSLSLGRAKKSAEVGLLAEIGLTRLYARRPVIAFNQMPLDLCVAKLCREAVILDAQQRNFNPVVTWKKTGVSAMEALDAILTANGFERKMTDTYHRASFKAQDYDSREEFVKAAVETLLERGKTMNEARAAAVVTPLEKSNAAENEQPAFKPLKDKPPASKTP
jgi:hypothetical protein